jgi:hypothetical protein
MKRSDLKKLIQECYKEVIAENQFPQPGPEYGDDRSSDNLDVPVITSDQKIEKTLAGWKAWGEKMKFLKDIRNEPDMIRKLDVLISATNKLDKVSAVKPVGE